MTKSSRVVLSIVGMVFSIYGAGASTSFAQNQSDENSLAVTNIDFSADDGVAFQADLPTCQNAVNNVARITDISLLNDCMDFFWHNGDAENPPGSFNNQITLGERWVQLDPQATQTYTVVAWLLWSKFATWQHDPKQMPDGATKAQEAIDLLLVGRRANPTDADYHLDCGETMLGLAKFHAPQYYSFVEDSYKLADRYFTDPAKKVRARLNLGHTYRYENKIPDAIDAYESVLAIDPNNVVAQRYLAILKK